MTTQFPALQVSPILHVFEQEGGWHWGITVRRAVDGGFKVIAYSEITFDAEGEARCNGIDALRNLSDLTERAIAS